MKYHTNCPQCKENDIEELDFIDIGSLDEGKVKFECLNCGCIFTQEYGRTTTWFEESIEILEKGKSKQ